MGMASRGLENSVFVIQVECADFLYGGGCYTFEGSYGNKPMYKNEYGAGVYWHIPMGAWVIALEVGGQFWAYRSKGGEEFPPLGLWAVSHVGRPAASVSFRIRRE